MWVVLVVMVMEKGMDWSGERGEDGQDHEREEERSEAAVERGRKGGL